MSNEPPILTVNHNPQNLNLLTQFLAKEDYTTYPVKSLDEFDHVLVTQMLFCMALIDVTGFDQHIWSRCAQLQDNNIPFIIISSKQSASIYQASLGHGAKNVLIKPLAIKELLAIIHSLLGG